MASVSALLGLMLNIDTPSLLNQSKQNKQPRLDFKLLLLLLILGINLTSLSFFQSFCSSFLFYLYYSLTSGHRLSTLSTTSRSLSLSLSLFHRLFLVIVSTFLLFLFFVHKLTLFFASLSISFLGVFIWKPSSFFPFFSFFYFFSFFFLLVSFFLFSLTLYFQF